MFENLEQLMKTIRERKNSPLDKSYTNKLLNDKNLSVAKVKEEIGELREAVEQNSFLSFLKFTHYIFYLDIIGLKINHQMINYIGCFVYFI